MIRCGNWGECGRKIIEGGKEQENEDEEEKEEEEEEEERYIRD